MSVTDRETQNGICYDCLPIIENLVIKIGHTHAKKRKSDVFWNNFFKIKNDSINLE